MAKNKTEKVKKPIFKRWWFWALIVVIALLAFSGGSKEAEPSTNTITLSWDQAGDYGREIVLNAGTEDEYKFFGFYLPAGEYKAENKNSKGGEQLSFCEGGITTRDDGVEEVTIAEQKPIVIMAGESAQFTLEDGQYIKLSDGAQNIAIEKIG